MARIVLHPFGSFGDLHPFLGIAIELARRGHEAVIATAEVYREKILAEGVGFHAVRPDIGRLLGDRALLAKVWDARRGTEYLLRNVIFPVLEDSYADLSEAAQHADLLVTHTAGYAGPLVAEKLGKKWISAVLQPLAFFSRFDPPVVGGAAWLRHSYRFSKLPFRLMRAIAEWQTTRWAEGIARLRSRLGLGRGANPVFQGQFSPFGTLALFSSCLARPQPDWPRNTLVTGFVFYDRLGGGFDQWARESSGLDEFLDKGSAPVVFTLGSSAVMSAGTFFEESARAAKQLGTRAVLLTGWEQDPAFTRNLPESIFVAGYAPYSALLPRALATVHQGGIGTTAQALRAARPMLVVPWAHDQPDNAFRLEKLGAARTLARLRYTAKAAAGELRALLEQSEYRQVAEKAAQQIGSEDGAAAACDRIERVLNS